VENKNADVFFHSFKDIFKTAPPENEFYFLVVVWVSSGIVLGMILFGRNIFF
jgi:hypothetical protein